MAAGLWMPQYCMHVSSTQRCGACSIAAGLGSIECSAVLCCLLLKCLLCCVAQDQSASVQLFAGSLVQQQLWR
jgi:hypothetical protein